MTINYILKAVPSIKFFDFSISSLNPDFQIGL